MDQSDATVQWRRDASTSRTVRLLWSLGVGTFFAMVSLVVFWRLFDLAGQVGGETAGSLTGIQIVLVAAAGSVAVTVVALAVVGRSDDGLDSLATTLPIVRAGSDGLRRGLDAALGTVLMTAVIVSFMAIGRAASQAEGGAFDAGPFTLLAALTLPVALVAIVLSSFLRSVGTLDRDEEILYLHEPDAAVPLEHVQRASIRPVGDAAILRLRYDQSDGTYVPGPRRLVVPQGVAEEVQRFTGTAESRGVRSVVRSTVSRLRNLRRRR